MQKGRSMRTLRFLFVACVIPVLCSCGNNNGLATVTGTVRYKGKPLTNAYIAFVPDESGVRSASATTDSEGRYYLTTFQSNDGAPIGKHRVVIRAEEEPEGPRLAADDINYKRGKLLTPARYSDPELSGLTAEVIAKKKNVIDFDLTD